MDFRIWAGDWFLAELHVNYECLTKLSTFKPRIKFMHSNFIFTLAQRSHFIKKCYCYDPHNYPLIIVGHNSVVDHLTSLILKISLGQYKTCLKRSFRQKKSIYESVGMINFLKGPCPHCFWSGFNISIISTLLSVYLKSQLM